MSSPRQAQERDAFAEQNPDLALAPPASGGDAFSSQNPDLADKLSSPYPDVTTPRSFSADPRIANADRQTGADFDTRLAAGYKLRLPEKLAYLHKRYGKDNVLVHDGEIYFRGKEGNFIKFDPTPSTIGQFFADLPGDIADVPRELIEQGGATAGALYGASKGAVLGPWGALAGGVIGAGVGGGLGNIAAQGISLGVPGEENVPLSERAAEVRTAVATNAAAEGVGRLGLKLWDFVRPGGNWFRSIVRSGESPTMMAEGRALAKETGIDFDYAQLSGGRSALRMKGTLAQREASGDIVFEEDLKRAQQFTGYARKLIDEQGGPVSSAEAGAKIGRVFNTGLTLMKKARRDTAKKLYGKVDEAAGGEPTILVQNLLTALDHVRTEFAGLLDPGQAERLAINLGKAIDPIVENGRAHLLREAAARGASKQEIKRITEAPWWELKGMRVEAKPFQNAMSDYKQRLDDSLGPIPGIASPKRKAAIQAQVLEAMRADLDATAKLKGVNAKVVKALRKANDTYRKMSQEIESSQTELLVNALKLNKKQAPDVAFRNFFTTASDDQVKASLAVINQMDPDLTPQIRAAMLGELLDAARVKTGGFAAREATFPGGTVISPAQIAQIAIDKADRFKAIYHGDAQGYLRFRSLVRAAVRLADRASVGEGGAQTEVLRQFIGASDMAVQALTNQRSFVEKLLTVFNSKHLARLMSTKEGVAELTKIMDSSTTTKAVVGTINRLAATLAVEESREQ
jgi:hypothetical protein